MKITYYDLGRRIKTARKERGLTQAKLAEIVGVGNTHISHIETGKTIPSFELVVNVMNALDLTPNELIRGYVDNENTNILLQKELAGILEDCSASELKFLSGCLVTLKSLLRSYETERAE